MIAFGCTAVCVCARSCKVILVPDTFDTTGQRATPAFPFFPPPLKKPNQTNPEVTFRVRCFEDNIKNSFTTFTSEVGKQLQTVWSRRTVQPAGKFLASGWRRRLLIYLFNFMDAPTCCLRWLTAAATPRQNKVSATLEVEFLSIPFSALRRVFVLRSCCWCRCFKYMLVCDALRRCQWQPVDAAAWAGRGWVLRLGVMNHGDRCVEGISPRSGTYAPS